MYATSTSGGTHDSIEFKKSTASYKIHVTNCEEKSAFTPTREEESSDSDDDSDEPVDNERKIKSQIIFMSGKPLQLPNVNLKVDSEVRSQSTHHSSGHDDCLSECQILSEKTTQQRQPSATTDGSRFNSCCSEVESFDTAQDDKIVV